MTGYNGDWVGVGYPPISGGVAWTEIVLTSDAQYGHQRVCGYVTAESYSRILSVGVWGPWVKDGGGGGNDGATIVARATIQGNPTELLSSFNVSGLVDEGIGDYRINFIDDVPSRNSASWQAEEPATADDGWSKLHTASTSQCRGTYVIGGYEDPGPQDVDYGHFIVTA